MSSMGLKVSSSYIASASQIADGITTKKVSTTTLTGNTTTFDITGLDLATDKEYIIDFHVKNATAGDTPISMYYNDDTTDNHYDDEYLLANGGASACSHEDNARIIYLIASAYAHGRILINRNADGYTRASQVGSYGTNAAIGFANYSHVWSSSTNNITKITFTAAANSMATGSVFSLSKNQI